MGWRHDSKLSRIENALGRIKPAEVSKILAIYGVTDPDVFTALENLARDAGKQGWWHTYGDVVPVSYKDYLWLEEDADTDHAYTHNVIPGLLQTGAYAREIIAATAPTHTPEKVAALAEIRKSRQAILTREPKPLSLWAVINEAAFSHRFAGYPGLMREQLRHVLDLTELPNISVQVMPLNATPHPGMMGMFHVLRFPAPWPTVINLETLQGGSLAEAHDDVKVYESAFDSIVAAALPPDDSRQLIKKIMQRTET